jgi:ribosomal protein S7
LLWHPGTEDVSLRVEAARMPASMRSLRAVVRARARRTGYEVHAIADLLPRKSREVLRARWVNSYSRGSYEDAFPDILHEVVLEAARANHRDFQRTREEVERVATALPPVASP